MKTQKQALVDRFFFHIAALARYITGYTNSRGWLITVHIWEKLLSSTGCSTKHIKSYIVDQRQVDKICGPEHPQRSKSTFWIYVPFWALQLSQVPYPYFSFSFWEALQVPPPPPPPPPHSVHLPRCIPLHPFFLRFLSFNATFAAAFLGFALAFSVAFFAFTVLRCDDNL